MDLCFTAVKRLKPEFLHQNQMLSFFQIYKQTWLRTSGPRRAQDFTAFGTRILLFVPKVRTDLQRSFLLLRPKTLNELVPLDTF